MPRRWQVWGQPDGSLVWVPASDAPPPPPPPPLAAAPPLPPLPPPPPAEELAPAASSDDALSKGAGPADGCRVQSMADLLTEARNNLMEGDGMAGATEDAGKGGMFCTGSGRSVAASDRAIRRARALVGEEAVETSNKRKQPFGDGADLEGELRETDVSFRGGVHKDSTPPMFQTGSGKAVLLCKDSIQKARAVLEGNVENAAGAILEWGGRYLSAGAPLIRQGLFWRDKQLQNKKSQVWMAWNIFHCSKLVQAELYRSV